MSNQQAINRFSEAREHYDALRFDQARVAIHRYRKNIDYTKFRRVDRRESNAPEISVIIVSFGTQQGLIECIDTVLKQQGPVAEIIVVDNGHNEPIHDQLDSLPLLWISPPFNLMPSEGRNVGAHFAQSDLLVFLDDDALMEPGYLAVANKTMAVKIRLGLRGRIRPKSVGTESPPHYDLGDAPVQSEFNLEGNMVIRKSDFDAIGGFDPIMFGHEGKYLTQQAKLIFPNKEIQYRPEIVVRHDWAAHEKLDRKNDRQAKGRAYLKYMEERKLDKGVSLIIKSHETNSGLNELLQGIQEFNTFKPLELWIWTKNTKEALAISRRYLNSISVRVLPAGVASLGELVNFVKYENIIIITKPVNTNGDQIERWLKRKKINDPNIKIFSKQQIKLISEEGSNVESKRKIDEIEIEIEIGKVVGESIKLNRERATNAEHNTEKEKKTDEYKEAGNIGNKLEARINKNWEYIRDIDSQLLNNQKEINFLDQKYMNLPSNSPLRTEISGKIEHLVVESSKLLLTLKAVHQEIHELRIRKMGVEAK